MMSSRRAAPHQGSGWVTPPTHQAEYMAATVFPSAAAHTALAFGLGPYMTEQEIEQDRNCHYDLQSSIKAMRELADGGRSTYRGE
jgi:hypothetical protein